MEVFFETEKLAKQLGQDKNRVKAFGPEGAKRIDLRLQQLGAARSLEDMKALPGRCHELTGDLRGHLAVDVHQPYRLIFRPTDNPPPMKPDGGLDWTAVDSITVTEITDYH
jgi:proteic killer suppression protein